MAIARKSNLYNLPPLQWRFVQEYLIDLNGSAAYQRAGYKARGHGAEANAHRLLRKAEVAAAIQTEQAKRSERTKITQDAVLQELALLDFSNVSDYVIDDYGNVTVQEGGQPEAMRAISSLRKRITHHPDGSISYDTELRLWNKPAALRMSGQHTGTFKDQVDISGTIKVVRLPQKAASADAWQQSRGHEPLNRRTSLGTAAEAD